MKEIIAQIKCLFGFCDELDEIKIKEKLAVDATYKVEPMVKTIKPKDDFGKIDNDTKKAVKSTKSKPKRSWYNNGKTQKLVELDKVSKLAKTWKKGKLKKS